MHHLFNSLKKYYPELHDARQIRQSVIIHWIGHYNLRQVQYMAGHRYVSITERYRMDGIADLQKELARYHPLDWLKGTGEDHRL